MATDIAFALGAIAILGRRVPASVKVSIVAFAIIDDLCAIVIIAVFYTADLSMLYLGGALAVWGLLILANRFFRMTSLAPYLLGGVLMWFLMFRSEFTPRLPESCSPLPFRFPPVPTTPPRLRTNSNTFYTSRLRS